MADRYCPVHPDVLLHKHGSIVSMTCPKCDLAPGPIVEVSPDPIVQLPPDHWIVRAWQEFRGSSTWVRLACWALEPDARRIEQFMWHAFAAGARSISGNPERVAELERALAEVQTDARVLGLEKEVEELAQIVSTVDQYQRDLRAEQVWAEQHIKDLERTVSSLNTLVESMRTYAAR